MGGQSRVVKVRKIKQRYAAGVASARRAGARSVERSAAPAPDTEELFGVEM